MAKRALLIGINRYAIPGADLRGCVNDVKNMKELLVNAFGFSGSDVATLTDLGATKRAITAGIKELVASGRRGDTLVLHYSGHGSNVPDDDGDEADHRDEILCPSDLDWKDPLRDDWLRATFDRLKEGVKLTVVMDCCHSGTNTRAIQPPDAPVIERYLPSPWDLAAAESGRRLRGAPRGTLRGSTRAAQKKQDIVAASISEVLVAGCRSTQTSADAHIGGSFNGALTYHLVAAAKEAKGKLSNRELHQSVVKRLKADGFDQVPQLEARKSRFDEPFVGA